MSCSTIAWPCQGGPGTISDCHLHDHIVTVTLTSSTIIIISILTINIAITIVTSIYIVIAAIFYHWLIMGRVCGYLGCEYRNTRTAACRDISCGLAAKRACSRGQNI